MATKVHGRRYAQAVFELALEKKQPDKWQSDLVKLAGLGQDAALMAVLQSPRLSFADKTRLLAGQLKDVSPYAVNLVSLLVSKGKFSLIGGIAAEYNRLLDSYRGIGKAEVATAIPLDPADTQNLAERLGTVFNKKIVITTAVDPGLIGGIVARVDGKLVDGSTKSRLAALKNELAGINR